jgi:glycosyltransferase involved in cell wall biosynthesis
LSAAAHASGAERLRLAIWSPLPPSPSGIADYVAETLPELARAAALELVVEDPTRVATALARRYTIRAAADAGAAGVAAADLDLYHVGNSPAHAYVYRAALTRPGVVVLHDFNLHQLVLFETVERAERETYLRQMRRAYGARGSLAGRAVSQALGGQLLPALFPLNERLLSSALGVVALTRRATDAVRARLGERPALHLPHHLSLPLDPLPSQHEARRVFGWADDDLLLVAPGLATAHKQLDLIVAVVARLRRRFARLRLVIAGGVDPALPLGTWAEQAGLGDGLVLTGRLSLEDFVRALLAADVVSALRFPSLGEMSGALVRALGVGRPVLVTSGTPGCEELPEGLVVPVDPGVHAAGMLETCLARLLADPELRATIGHWAREHVLERHALPGTVETLAQFLLSVHAQKAALDAQVARRRTRDDSLLQFLLDEVSYFARDLGLSDFPLALEERVAFLAGCEP